MKTSKNDNKSVWIKSREHLHVEWLLFFVLFPWKSCNVNGRRCQELMAAPGMIQTPWCSKDHSSQSLSETETTQSLTKVFKNNIFHIRWKLCRWNEKKKNRKLKKLPILPKMSKHVTSYVLATWRSAVNVVQWLRWFPTLFLAFGTSTRKKVPKKSTYGHSWASRIFHLGLRAGKKCFKLHQSYLISFMLAKFSWVQSERDRILV